MENQSNVIGTIEVESVLKENLGGAGATEKQLQKLEDVREQARLRCEAFLRATPPPPRTVFKLNPVRQPSSVKPLNPINATLLQYLPRWQENNSPYDLGIIRFAFELFPHIVDKKYGIAKWVRPAMYEVLKFKDGDKKIDRCHAICTSRDFSKSTWFVIILNLYFILVGQYGIYVNGVLIPETDYTIIRGKTYTEAEKRVNDIVYNLTLPNIVALFGSLNPTFKETKDKKLKNNTKVAMFNNGYILQPLGITQSSRGSLMRSHRVKLFINDDVESTQNTKTQTVRENTSKEVLGGQFGGLADDGLMIYIGNYVHTDCLLHHLLINEGWHPQFYQMSYINSDGVEVSGWEEKYSMRYIRALAKWFSAHEDQGGYKLFRLEYYNEIISDKSYIFKNLNCEFEHREGKNYLRLEKLEGDNIQVRYIPCYIVVGCDPSISLTKKSCDGAVTVTAFLPMKRRVILDYYMDKYDIRDRYADITKKPKVVAFTSQEMQNVTRRGMVDEMGRAIIRYHADAFVVEKAGQQQAWFTTLEEEIVKPLNLEVQGIPFQPTGDKEYRIKTELLIHVANGYYYIRNSMPHKSLMHSRLAAFPDVKLDVFDSLTTAEYAKRFPVDESYTSQELFSIKNRVTTSEYDLLEKAGIDLMMIL